jgi:hypothetical protein
VFWLSQVTPAGVVDPEDAEDTYGEDTYGGDTPPGRN